MLGLTKKKTRAPLSASKMTILHTVPGLVKSEAAVRNTERPYTLPCQATNDCGASENSPVSHYCDSNKAMLFSAAKACSSIET